MNEKTITAAIVCMGIFILILFAIIQDLNRIVHDNAETIDAMKVGTPAPQRVDRVFIGTVLQIPIEIYNHDWVYVQENRDQWYDNNDVLLGYEDCVEGVVVVQFPDFLEDGHLYYSYEANISNNWWQPRHNRRRSITGITFEQTIIDNFDDPTSNNTVWREE